jgi:iron-sulfur cluster insertion protein
MTENDSTEWLNISDKAATKVLQLISMEPNPAALKLRVYIVGGGCSGFQYGFKLDATVNPEDCLIKKGPVSMVVASMCRKYLEGATVDYIENLQGAQFMIHNPNAETTCGCGSSFSLKTCPKQ